MDIRKKGSDYGRSDFGKGEKVNIEFVSANPTGPMHMGNARGGALGDCLAAVMDFAGYNVSREFYINDAAIRSINSPSRSISAISRYTKAPTRPSCPRTATTERT